MIVRRDRGMLAVLIMLDVAFHAGRTSTVSAADIAERAGLARRGIEPLLQALSRSGLLESIRGPRGGYRLGRARRDLPLSSIVAAAQEGDVDPPAPEGRLQSAVLAPLWDELDGLCRARLEALTIDDLMKRALSAGLQRPAQAPVDFAI